MTAIKAIILHTFGVQVVFRAWGHSEFYGCVCVEDSPRSRARFRCFSSYASMVSDSKWVSVPKFYHYGDPQKGTSACNCEGGSQTLSRPWNKDSSILGCILRPPIWGNYQTFNVREEPNVWLFKAAIYQSREEY